MKDFDVVLHYLAHLIQDVKCPVKQANKNDSAYGQLLLDDLRRLFGVIRRYDEYPSRTASGQS